MIPRKVAKRLLDEHLERLRDEGVLPEPRPPEDVTAELLDRSDLVLRGAENVAQKGCRYVTEGRLRVERIEASGLIVATCRGTTKTHRLGYDPKKREWRCTCQARGRCSHLAALQLVVDEPARVDSPDVGSRTRGGTA